MDWFSLFFLFTGVMAATVAATFCVLRILRKKSLLDHPNARSSHTTPTPRGGGLAVILVLVPVWLLIGLSKSGQMMEIFALCAGALALAAISWYDDLRGVAPSWRLFCQAAAAALVLAANGHGLYFAGLAPPFLDFLAAVILWVWFINLFNFMDGIDGISGAEAFCAGTGAALIAFIAGLDAAFLSYGLTLAAAALGFLWWNWHPARIFLGDVGSIPLGFLLGWLLLSLASNGQWAPALILPLYYLADATLTLSRRAFRLEKIWSAHREHYYQRAVQNGFSHAKTVLFILGANLLLMALAAYAALSSPLAAMMGAGLVVSTLILFFASARKKKIS